MEIGLMCEPFIWESAVWDVAQMPAGECEACTGDSLLGKFPEDYYHVTR